MCYEYSAWFFKARARQLRKEQLREEQQQRAQAQSQTQTHEPAAPQAQPAVETEKPRETVPV